MKTTTNYNSTTNQEIKGKFVQREIIENIGEIMQHLIKSEDKGDYEDEIYNVCSQPNYEDAATDNGWEYNEEDEEWTNEESEEIYATAQDVCEGENLDYNYFEAYEFLSISGYLGEKLEEKGEMVQDIFGFCVWGRCTTGQAILLDHVISEICEDMGILEGQPNDWSK